MFVADDDDEDEQLRCVETETEELNQTLILKVSEWFPSSKIILLAERNI